MRDDIKLTTIDILELVPNPRNPRRHPEAQIEQLAASIRKFGQPKPVLARKENRMLIAGHGVWESCQRAGLPKIKVMLWDVDQATADAFMVADNRHPENSRNDTDRIAELLREIDPSDLPALGFTPEEVAELLKGEDEDTIEVFEIDTTAVADRFWLSVRGPLKDQAQALQRVQEVMRDLPEVEVELGTVAVT